MSDTRSAIAERIVKEATPYAHLGNAQYVNAQALCEKCMSEYAAAVLEEMANIYFVQMTAETDFDYGRIKTRHDVAVDLRARAAQERERKDGQ